MATNIKRHTQYYSGNGDPQGSVFTSLNLYAHYFDRDAKVFWIYLGGGTWIIDPEYQGLKGEQGIQGVKGDTGATGPKGDTGATGPQGIPGTSTGGGSSASIVVVPNGVDDTANLQAAIQQNKTTGRPIELYGTYKTTRDLTIDKNHLNLFIEGKRATIEGFGLKRVKPTDNNEALNTMVGGQYHISGLTFKGGTFEPGPSYGSTFTNLRFEGAASLFRLQFSLGAKVLNPYFINCTKGLIIDYGDWAGANNFNSQSNHTQVIGGRFYGHATSEVAIQVNAASGCSVKDFIIEGFRVGTGIDYDAKGSTVVKDFSIENVHYECPNGGDQFIRLRMTGNDIVTIKKCFGQYPVKFLDASSTSGLSYVEIGHVTWWRGKGDTTGSNGTGKMFTTSNVTLHFEKNHAFNNLNAAMWEGTAPVAATDATEEAGAEGNRMAAYHTYTINYINPKV